MSANITHIQADQSRARAFGTESTHSVVSVSQELKLYDRLSRANKDLYYFLKDLTPARFTSIPGTSMPYEFNGPLVERIYSCNVQTDMMRREGHLYLTFVDNSETRQKPMVLTVSPKFFKNPPSQTAQKIELVRRLIQHEPCGKITVTTTLSLSTLNYELKESEERTLPDGRSVIELTKQDFPEYRPARVGIN